MMIDVIGSTTLSEELDPEEYRDLIASYRQKCAEIFTEFAGHVATLAGDGILVMFGYPRAHETDARRAVLAGLRIVAKLAQTGGALNTPPVDVRIGIHTGISLIGPLASGLIHEADALTGAVPNIASRIQAKSPANTVVISDATHRLVEGYFRCRSLGQARYRGWSRPIETYEVIEEAEAPSLFLPRRGLAALSGRDRDLAYLSERWERARIEQAQAVLLTGEPGIGKSRLIGEVLNLASNAGAATIVLHCNEIFQSTAFYPVISALARRCNLRPTDDAEAKRDKLHQYLSSARMPLSSDAVALVEQLLNITREGQAPAAPDFRLRVIDTLVEWALAEASPDGLLLVFEDLHWADDSSRRFLSELLSRSENIPLMCLVTSRLEGIGDWERPAWLTQLNLTRLTEPEARILIASLPGADLLPERAVAQIVAYADGVPLFIEEIALSVVESAVEKLNGLKVPVTLRDSLAASLDRLGEARLTCQIASVLGRTFEFGILKELARCPAEALETHLGAIERAGLVQRRGRPPDASYTFRHALIHEAAYESLVGRTRREYHARAAAFLISSDRDTASIFPEVVAHHYTAAAMLPEALPFWEVAARRAIERSASVEATQHLERALEALHAFRTSSTRDRKELELTTALGSQIIAAKGNADPRVGSVYESARRLSEQIGDESYLFRALRGLQTFNMVRGLLQVAYEYGEQTLTIAKRSGEDDLLLQAHRPHGLCLLYMGRFEEARAHLERAAEIYDAERHSQQRFAYGSDPGVLALCNLAWVEWFLGFPERAAKHASASITAAKALEHPHSLAFALSIAGSIHHLRRDMEALRHSTAEVLALSEEHNFPYWLSWNEILRGWLVAQDGDITGGLAGLEKGLLAYQATGAELMVPYFSVLLADALVADSRYAESLSAVQNSLHLTNQHGIRFYQVELVRIIAHAKLKLGHTEEASAEYRFAYGLACEQGSLNMRLRILTDCATHFGTAGPIAFPDELRHAYQELTEGHDEYDVRLARQFLGLD